MNVCIIVHSLTGTSLLFAQVLADKLCANSHVVDVVELKTNIPVASDSLKLTHRFELRNLPDVTKYDVIIAGGPVVSLSASPVIYKAINQFPSMKGKKFIPYVILSAPQASMGGTKALKILSQVAETQGAEVLTGIIITRLFNSFDTTMKTQAEKICTLLK